MPAQVQGATHVRVNAILEVRRWRSRGSGFGRRCRNGHCTHGCASGLCCSRRSRGPDTPAGLCWLESPGDALPHSASAKFHAITVSSRGIGLGLPPSSGLTIPCECAGCRSSPAPVTADDGVFSGVAVAGITIEELVRRQARREFSNVRPACLAKFGDSCNKGVTLR